MKAYSEDLRQRIVQATQRGVSKAQAARLFGVSLSSVKRYARLARPRGFLAPGKGSGRPPKIHQNAKKLLEKDLQERPEATVWQRRRFLERITAESLSDSSVGRTLKRGWASVKKTECGAGRKGRVLEGGLEDDGSREALCGPALVFVDEMGAPTPRSRPSTPGHNAESGRATRWRPTVVRTRRFWRA
jgi:transposase